MHTHSKAKGHRWQGQFALAFSLTLSASGCGGSVPASSTSAASASPPSTDNAASAPSEAAPSQFSADFSHDLGAPLNVFGAKNGNRRATGGADGLRLEILSAEKAWDAVGVRTAKVQVDGDFDLQGSYREFGASGEASTKLLVVDAGSTRGEAAYVERIRIAGKELFKFGGEVNGSLENWGFVEASGTSGDLRLVRRGGELHAYQRATENDGWLEFTPAQPAPKSMPRVVKVGVKLSAEAGGSAHVRWRTLSVEGRLTRLPL